MSNIRCNSVGMWLLCGLLVCGLLCPATAQVKHRLSVSDVAGYYITNDKSATYQTLSLSFAGKTSESGALEQGNFTGKYSTFPVVGQGIISGDEGQIDNFISFDFMYLEPQDETLLLHSTTIMRKGRVIGLLINEAGLSPDGRKRLPVKYLRVSHEEFIRFQKAHSK